MGSSRIGWAIGTIAPWWLGAALALSFPADAGQEASSGASLAPLAWRGAAQPAALIPLAGPAGAAFAEISGQAGRLLRKASLVLDDPREFARLSDEIEPRADLKRNAGPLPAANRERRGDPLVGLRPTFDGRLRQSGGQSGGLARLRTEALIFSHDETSPTSSFAPGGSAADPEAETMFEATFEPWPEGEAPTTARASAEASPRQNAAAVTMRPAALAERLMQGATPPVERATALGSTTPTSAESTPVEVVALPATREARTPGLAELPRLGLRPDFAALIDQDQSEREKRCLAEAIYFEARSETEEGQAAVAQVVLNRVSSGLYPTTICGVVYQNRRHANACQFSFACEGKSLRVNEAEAWRAAVRIADAVTTGRTYLSDVGNSTHYHANYVRPRWARRLERMDVIGRHVFYKLRPGQT